MILRRQSLQRLSLLSLGLSLLCLGTSPAQAHSHRDHHGRRGPGLMAQLELSTQQTQELSAIREEFRERRRELRHKGELDKAQRRALVDRLRKDKRAKINALLTDEQKAKRDELRKARHDKRLNKRLEKMSRKLSLSDAQRGKLEALFRRAATQRRAIRQDENLEHAARKAKLQAHRAQVDIEISALLTPQQNEEFATFKAKRKKRKNRRRGRRGRRFDF